MKIPAITSLAAIIIASAQAALPLTNKGCQCLSDCKICSSYHSVFGCGVLWQGTWICSVNAKTCDDYEYRRDGKVADQCGSWKDPFTNLYARVKSWFHDSARNVQHLNAKVTEWATEYVRAVDVSDLMATEPDVLAKLASIWEKFDENQLNQLKSLAGDKLKTVIRQIPVKDLTALSTAVQSKLGFGPEIIERLKSITAADVTSWADEQWGRVPVDNLVSMSQGVLQQVPIAQVGKWTEAQWGKLAPAWEKLQDTQLNKLKALAGSNLDALFKQISKADLAALSTAVQSKLGFGPEVIERLKSITLADVASWADEQWDRVPVDNLASMGWNVLQKVPLSELGKWTKEQWVKIPVDKLVRFTGDQIGKIDAASLAGLSDKYWDKVPVYQIAHFSVELIQSAGLLQNLNATQIGYFTEKQWKAMPVESIVKFSVDKLHAVDYKVLGEWTKEMWDKVPIETIAAFVYQQIQAVPAEVVGQSHCRLSWYKRAKTAKVSG